MDTSGPFCVVAAVEHEVDSGEDAAIETSVDTAGLRFGATGTVPRAHAEELAPLLSRVMAQGKVDHVAAGRGPGSFTGLRVGLATAQALAWALDVPVFGLCSLDVIARQAGLDTGWAVMDARRGELFYRRYQQGIAVGDPEVAPRTAVRTLVADDGVVGDVELLASDRPRDRGTTTIDPAALALVARAAVGDPAPATPLYLRRPDVHMTAANTPGGAP